MNIFKKVRKLFNFRLYLWVINTAKPFKLTFIIILLTNILLSSFTVLSAVISKEMIDKAVVSNILNAMSTIILFVGLHLVNVVLGIVNGMLIVRMTEKMTNRVQRDLIGRMYATEWVPLNKFHSGDVLTRLTSDVSNLVSLWVSSIPSLISLLIQLVLAFGTLMYFDPSLALFTFALGPVSVAFGWFLGRKLKKFQHLIQAAESKNRSYITEAVQNILIVKSFEYEKESLSHITRYQNEKYKWVIKKSNLGVFSNTIFTLGYWLGFIAAFLWGALKLSKKTASFGTFVAFLQLVGQIQAPFDNLTRLIPQMISSLASVERLMEFELLEKEKAKTLTNSHIQAKVGIQVDHVSFGYSPEKQILHDVSFKVKPGEISALIGVSGEGKTTFMRLLLALLKPEHGGIYIQKENGEKTELSSDTRRYFTYVPQGNTLFTGTIKENLLVGKPDATIEEIERVLKAACAWDFIQSFPNKTETIVGESGTGLSEGQAQRICIARALLKPSPVLLLDEATSALDMETEKKVFANIRSFEPIRTCIAITHRLSVLSSCDSVYRLENGRVYRHEVMEFAYLFEKEKDQTA